MITAPIQTAIVGLKFGQYALRDMLEDDNRFFLKPCLLCDEDPKQLEAILETGIPTCSSIETVLADPNVAAVALFSEPVGRSALIRRIVAAGKDVITSGPFDVDPESAMSVLKFAKGLGRVVHLNTPGPYPTDDLLLAKRWVHEYGLGRLVGCRADVWASYNEQSDGSWCDDPGVCSVPPIYRLGICHIYDFLFLAGPVESVQVVSSWLRTGRPTADSAQMSLSFVNGALGSIFSSFCVGDGDHYRYGMVLNYENGTIYKNIGPQRAGKDVELSLVMAVGGERSIVKTATIAERRSSGRYDWKMFFYACRHIDVGETKREDDIVDGLRVIEALAQAALTGHTVTLLR